MPESSTKEYNSKNNPALNFKFDLRDMERNPLSDNYLLFDMKTKSILNRDTIYKYNVSDLDISVIYHCSDLNCSLRPEDIERGYDKQFNFYLNIKRQLFTLNLQDKEQPIILSDNYLSSLYVMNQDHMQSVLEFWQIINVTEEKGMLDNFIGKKKNLLVGIYIEANIII